MSKACQAYHTRREEDSWLDVVERNVAGDLRNCISHSEDGVDLVELISSEVELFPHASDIGIGQVRTIQVIEEVHQTAEGKNEEVELPYQLPLGGRAVTASQVLDKAPHFEKRGLRRYSCSALAALRMWDFFGVDEHAFSKAVALCFLSDRVPSSTRCKITPKPSSSWICNLLL